MKIWRLPQTFVSILFSARRRRNTAPAEWMNEWSATYVCRESATSFRYPHPQGSPPRSSYILDPQVFRYHRTWYMSMCLCLDCIWVSERLVQMQVMLSWLDLHREILTFTSFSLLSTTNDMTTSTKKWKNKIDYHHHYLTPLLNWPSTDSLLS